MNYGTAKWKKKRLRILKLDGYKDRVAAMYGKTLEANMVHHIYPADEYQQWAFETWNLISINREETHNKLENRKTGELTDLGRKLQDLIKPYQNWRKQSYGTYRQAEPDEDGSCQEQS